MGYDLFIHRNVFVDRSNVSSLPHLKSDSNKVVISELLLSLRGWEVSQVVQDYLDSDKQELSVDELIKLYQDCCYVQDVKVDQNIIELLQTDYEQHTHWEDGGVFYELTQSY